jgi:uncharacterized protein with GYD domain
VTDRLRSACANAQKEQFMPKYLMEVSYTAQGAGGVLKDGGTKRLEAARSAVQSVGGTLEAMYFAFGDCDVVCITDMPDAASMAAASLSLSASGAVTSRTRVLVTAEEIDAASKKTPSYTPPGR